MKFDDLLDLSAEQPLSIDVDSCWTSDASPKQHADFVALSEIAAAVDFVVAHYVMNLERVVEPPDSSKDVGAGVIVAVDDFEVFESGEIVEFVVFQLEVCQRDLDSANVRSLFGLIPYDCSLDAGPL